jgi:hypothetical protein
VKLVLVGAMFSMAVRALSWLGFSLWYCCWCRACADALRHSWVLSRLSFEVRLGQVEVYGVLGFGVDAGMEACRARFGAAVLLTSCGWACPFVCLTMKS